MPPSLLAPDEPAPFEIMTAGGRSPFFLTCDHASRRLPKALGTLGLPDNELYRHIAWDIGAAAVARHLSRSLDAFLILQNYSRLAIDCNRPPSVAGSIATSSEDTDIPGNRDLSPADAEARRAAIFQPYHDRIAAELNARRAAGRPTILVAMHSFTPVFRGVSRPWHVGVLYNRDARLAHALLQVLRAEPGLVVGDNEPYFVSDETDYGIPIHAEARGLPHVELEVRQDLIADPGGQARWAALIERALLAAATVPGIA